MKKELNPTKAAMMAARIIVNNSVKSEEVVAEIIDREINATIKECSNQVPTTWLDNLLTGPNAVIGKSPYDCPAIEALCKGIKERILVTYKKEGASDE